jgi:hypothetical protein
VRGGFIINGGGLFGPDNWRLMPGSCDCCGSPLIQIDHYDDRLTGCPACNVWRGDKSAFIVELTVEDWEALGKLRESVKWTLRPRKTQPKKE